MLDKYKRYHLDRLASSTAVLASSVWHNHADLKNPHGLHWAAIGRYVLGLADVRPRLGTFTNPWGAVSNSLFAAPPVRAVSDSLGDLLNQRACELLLGTRRIAIMWSGGIDSTCVLAALIKNSKSLDQLVVYCSRASIEENTYFYKNHILNQIETRDTSTLDVTDDFIKTHVLLHGDPADCLYGPSMPMYRNLLPDSQHLLPWRSHRNLIIDGIVVNGATPEFARWYTDKISDNIEQVSTYNINTIADWWWWHYFNLKWEFSILRPFYGSRSARRPTFSQESLQSFANTTFYNTEYFQNWSYSNLDRLCRDPARHKIEAKQYIFELDQNDFYLNNKRKTESLASNPLNWPVYLDQDLKPYYSTDPGVKEAMIELLEQYKG